MKNVNIVVKKYSIAVVCIVTRKLFLEVCERDRLKQACSSTETSLSIEVQVLLVYTQHELSRERITKVLTGLRGCAGWSAPMLFASNSHIFTLRETCL